MGVFDKMKAIKNAVTGGAAKVFVDVADAKLREPFQVTVRAEPQGCEVKYDRVYLKFKGVEAVEVPDYDVQYQENGETRTRREIVKKKATTIEHEVTVASAGVLADGESGEWTVDISMPSNATPEFRGRFATHSYRVFAGLDCFGNDPDSGWVDISMS